MKKVIVLLTSVLVFLGASPALGAITVGGSHGEKLTVSQVKIGNEKRIKVSGKNFDETVGIYLGFCVLPKKGEIPSPCGGGINKQGIGDASYWISSNPPPYGKGVADPYLPGGRFTYFISVSKKIGNFDCRKVTCAVTVRADHLRTEDRSYDIFIPIKFK